MSEDKEETESCRPRQDRIVVPSGDEIRETRACLLPVLMGCWLDMVKSVPNWFLRFAQAVRDFPFPKQMCRRATCSPCMPCRAMLAAAATYIGPLVGRRVPLMCVVSRETNLGFWWGCIRRRCVGRLRGFSDVP